MALTRRTVLGVVTTGSLAGCLGGGGGDDGTDSPTADGVDGGATVQVRSHAELDDVLVGPDGRTLYMFEQDTTGEPASACTGGCADAWPPLTVEDSPTTGGEVAADVSAFERDDGSMQVAAGGWPLYYFVDDEAPGDANGQGSNDVWWVLDPTGSPKRSTGSEGGGY